MLGWIGYQKINEIKIKQVEKQAGEQKIDATDADVVDKNADESLNRDQTQKIESDDKSAIANPASVYCEEQGYKLEIRAKENGSQYGVCVFDDGSECEEWAYFRGECAKGNSLRESAEDYIYQHIAEISPQQAVLGGKWFVTGLEFVNDEKAIIDYEDGHIQGKIEVSFSIENNQVKIEDVKNLLTDVKEDINADWNSFTHKAYSYTIKFPKNWHWDGTDVKVLIISSESIKSKDENLTLNNLKIIKADQEIIEGILEKNPDAEIASLNDNFKAAYLKNHQFKNIIEQIIKSFEI